MERQQQQQQQQRSSAQLGGQLAAGLGQSLLQVLCQPSLLRHVLRHLTRRDGCALALACTATAQAHAAAGETNAPAPRLLVVASGSSKLLALPLRHDGQPYAGTEQPFITAARTKAPPKRRRARIGASARNQQWLTGVAACTERNCVLVADYAARGIVQLSTGSLRYQRVLSSGSVLSTPEGVALHPDASVASAYVACVEGNHIAALRLGDGAISQLRPLPEGLVPWGLAAWRWRAPQLGAHAAAAEAGAWAAALFVAVDVAYESRHYYLPPDRPATGGVLMVPLLGGGVNMGQPMQYSSATKVKRPSGLCFDAQGCLWVTSLDVRLLRLAGPAAAAPGALLQELALPELLPPAVRTFLPFDVAAVCHASDDSSDTGQQAETQLAVTLHRGPAAAGAVAVLRLRHGHAVEGAADACLICCLQHAALKQPNMLAVLR